MRSVISIEETSFYTGLNKAMKSKSKIDKSIEVLDLDSIKYKLIRESGWHPDKAARVEGLYRVYLQLVLSWPDEVHVPTEEIDEMWHAHILDTYKYMEDCKNIFGYYLHHFPYLGLRGDEDAKRAEDKFSVTRRRFFMAQTATAALMCG